MWPRRRNQDALFAESDLQNDLSKYLSSEIVDESINSLSESQILAIPPQDLVEHIAHEHDVTPLVICEDNISAESCETKVDVSLDQHRPFIRNRSSPVYVKGGQVELTIPYCGDTYLWGSNPGLGPGRHSLGAVVPHGSVHAQGEHGGSIKFRVKFAHDDMSQHKIQAQIDQNLGLIKNYVARSKQSVASYHSDLRRVIERKIEDRKAILIKINDVVEQLEIPLKRNPEAPSTTPVYLSRRRVRPLPPDHELHFEPEPGICSEDYEYILSVIRHEIATFEATPMTYENLPEEHLRDILLGHLNGHYSGDATGETFRRKGKTDIRIEDGARSAFVAECKVWRGPLGFRSTIDQLFDYLTWRDCKASIVIFNRRNRGFSGILCKIAQELAEHCLAKREVMNQRRPGEWRFVFRARQDELREITVHVFAADLFVEPRRTV